VRNKSGFLYEFKRKKSLFILMLPGVLFLLMNNYLPMVGSLIAFKRITLGANFYETFVKSPFVGFDNFKFFMNTSYAWIITRNTVLFNLAFISIGLVLAVAVAIALNEIFSKKLAKFYQSIMILPNFLSWVVVSIIVYAFLSDKGYINGLLTNLHKEPINFYFEAKYWVLIIIVVQVWYFLGSSAVIYLASITGINSELFESAMIDGATKWQQIKSITLPMIRPTMVFMVILSLGTIFTGNFGLFYNVPRESGPLFNVTNVIDTYVFRSLNQTGNLEMAAAASFYQSVVGFAIVMITNGILRKVSKDDAVF
jgi:putative aldouronate transport system permease protein